MVLEKINQPNDIKSLTDEELKILASEIREFLIEKISVTGGHLGIQYLFSISFPTFTRSFATVVILR